jgi:D-alanine--poly(phosphoribitol) ligase subunit 1
VSATDVLSAVLEHAGGGPDRPAVKDLERALTYGELVDEVGRVAAGLVARGVRPGDRVAIHLPNSVDFVVAALASLWTGAIFVPLAVTDPEARLAAILADCAPAVVITADGGHQDRVPAASTLAGPTWVAVATLGLGGPPPSARADPGTERVAYAIYTSGTTGTPKGVLIGNRAMAAAVASTVDLLDLDASTRTLCVSPFHFDGSFATLFPTLYAGGAVVIRPRESLLFPRTFFNAVLGEGITYTGFSPSYLRLLLAAPQMDTLAGSALGVVALGGEAASAADVRTTWQAVPGLRVFNRYGPTEATIAVTHLELTPELLSRGTVPIGRPHAGVTFHVMDEDGRLVDQPGRVGELYIGGVQLMDGYWGAGDLTDAVMRTDVVPGTTVYRTGDLVTRDERGSYLYVDRADRVIKRSGVRISLVELSGVLQALEGVSGAACVTYDDEGGTGICAFVTTDGSASPLELRNRARRHLPDTMLPDRIDVVADLPLTRSGKLDERRLLADAGLAPTRSVSASLSA